MLPWTSAWPPASTSRPWTSATPPPISATISLSPVVPTSSSRTTPSSVSTASPTASLALSTTPPPPHSSPPPPMSRSSSMTPPPRRRSPSSPANEHARSSPAPPPRRRPVLVLRLRPLGTARGRPGRRPQLLPRLHLPRLPVRRRHPRRPRHSRAGPGPAQDARPFPAVRLGSRSTRRRLNRVVRLSSERQPGSGWRFCLSPHHHRVAPNRLHPALPVRVQTAPPLTTERWPPLAGGFDGRISRFAGPRTR